jgi:hypothetical protein
MKRINETTGKPFERGEEKALPIFKALIEKNDEKK